MCYSGMIYPRRLSDPNSQLTLFAVPVSGAPGLGELRAYLGGALSVSDDAVEIVGDVSVQAAGQVPRLADPVVVFTPKGRQLSHACLSDNVSCGPRGKLGSQCHLGSPMSYWVRNVMETKECYRVEAAPSPEATREASRCPAKGLGWERSCSFTME